MVPSHVALPCGYRKSRVRGGSERAAVIAQFRRSSAAVVSSVRPPWCHKVGLGALLLLNKSSALMESQSDPRASCRTSPTVVLHLSTPSDQDRCQSPRQRLGIDPMCHLSLICAGSGSLERRRPDTPIASRESPTKTLRPQKAIGISPLQFNEP